MTATKELRKLLDEREVEWGNVRNDGSESNYLTEWQLENNQGRAIATEWANGSGLSVEIHRYHLTPEQTIAATLGAGTCHKVLDFDGAAWICSECGEHIGPRRWNFCPNCGAKAVD